MTFDLTTLFGPGEFVGLLICTAVGLLGVFTHWLLKWTDGAIEGSLLDYLFRDNVRGTVKSILAFNGVFYGAWFGGFFDGSTARVVIVAAFMAGLGLDMALNKGKQSNG